jgi:fumarylacetoacetase
MSWLNILADTDFTIYNFPMGVFKKDARAQPTICSALGEYVIDLDALQELGFFRDFKLPKRFFRKDSINDYIGLGKNITHAIRHRLIDIFSEGKRATNAAKLRYLFLHQMRDVQLLLPLKIGDYTDFYSSREHATNVGSMFRDPAKALLANWLHIPIGYHGRASSIVVSGTPIHRPQGQSVAVLNEPKPIFGTSKRLDFELETAFVVGRNTQMGETIDAEHADDYIFGMVLLNDWSARDIQQWESQPLGPFLGKSFATTISAWVVPMEALDPFRVPSVKPEIGILPYLETTGWRSYDIELSASISSESFENHLLTNSNTKYLYWNMSQQLAHHTSNGCSVRVGDLMASGTISAPTSAGYGSMLELSWNGTKPISMPDGSQRTFLEGGDTVILRGFAEKKGIRVGFGECVGTITA